MNDIYSSVSARMRKEIKGFLDTDGQAAEERKDALWRVHGAAVQSVRDLNQVRNPKRDYLAPLESIERLTRKGSDEVESDAHYVSLASELIVAARSL